MEIELCLAHDVFFNLIFLVFQCSGTPEFTSLSHYVLWNFSEYMYHQSSSHFFEHFCTYMHLILCLFLSEPPDCSTSVSDSVAVSRYRSALVMHYEVIEQSTALDPVHCTRRLRSKHYLASPVVMEIERAEAAKGQSEASSRLVTHLSQLSDDGVCYFVNHYLTGSGLEKISSTIRHCPGPDICRLDAAECHIDTSLQENGKKQLTKYTVGCSICLNLCCDYSVFSNIHQIVISTFPCGNYVLFLIACRFTHVTCFVWYDNYIV